MLLEFSVLSVSSVVKTNIRAAQTLPIQSAM
jgi:hypothetical protein